MKKKKKKSHKPEKPAYFLKKPPRTNSATYLSNTHPEVVEVS